MYTTRTFSSLSIPLEEKKQTAIIGFFCGTNTDYDEIEMEKEAKLGCLFLKTTITPTLNNFSPLLEKNNSAFIQANQNIYYLNKQKRICEKVIDFDAITQEFLNYTDRESKEIKENEKTHTAKIVYEKTIEKLEQLDNFLSTLKAFKKRQPLSLKELDQLRVILPNIPIEWIDYSFKHIRHGIKTSPDTKIYGYSGCHVHGGGFFAYGTDVSCNDLYRKVCAEVAETKPPEKIKLHLIGHSRGCISIYQLIKQINANLAIRDSIEIVLDLREPVPGNFKITSQNDPGDFCISSQLRDLTTCTNVREVNITLQEETYIGGFSSLIPQFHPYTTLKIEYIPGHHSTQQTHEDELTYRLGLEKSLQILQENNIPLADKMKSRQELINEQIDKYNDLFLHYKDLSFTSRSVHFRGKFIKRDDDSTPSTLNMRHAELIAIQQNKPIRLLSPMLIFRGKDVDIHYSSFIHHVMQRYDKIDIDMLLSGINIELPIYLFVGEKSRATQLRHIVIYSDSLPTAKKILFYERLLNIQLDTPSNKDLSYIKDTVVMSLGKQDRLTLKDHFIEELEQYRLLRKEEAKNQRSEFHTLFGAIFTSMSATLKDNSLALFLQELKNPSSNPRYTRQQLNALRDGRLGKILSRYFNYLPEQFKAQERVVKIDTRSALYAVKC